MIRQSVHAQRGLLAAIGVLLITILCTADYSFAHIKNEASQFPDIEFSDARFDIVVLVGAGIIPESPVFEPDLPLSREDLATWGALFNNLGQGGETPDIEGLARAALEQGLVESLQGNATYAEINAVFFDGQLSIDDPAATPSRAEAASFIASRLGTEAGFILLEKRGLEVGPTGEVTGVESRSDPDGSSSYFITVGDMTLPMYGHGRVANGPTDLLQWQGRSVRRSFIRNHEDSRLWMYLEAEPREISSVDSNQGANADELDPAAAIDTNRNLLYGLLAGVLGLGLILFFKRKRVG